MLLILWTVTARGTCIGEQDVLREQKMLEEMSRRVKEGDDDEKRRLEEEVARHKVSACSYNRPSTGRRTSAMRESANRSRIQTRKHRNATQSRAKQIIALCFARFSLMLLL